MQREDGLLISYSDRGIFCISAQIRPSFIMPPVRILRLEYSVTYLLMCIIYYRLRMGHLGVVPPVLMDTSGINVISW